jgi:hypothetical protein
MEQCGRMATSNTNVKFLVNNANFRWVQRGIPWWWWWFYPSLALAATPTNVTNLADLPGVVTVKNNFRSYFIGKDYGEPDVGRIFNNTLTYASFGSFGSQFVYRTRTFNILTCFKRKKSQNE